MTHPRVLASGFGTVEGPTVDPSGALFFTDFTGGGVYRLTSDGAVSLAVPKRRGVGGLCLHADGGLVVSGRDISYVREGDSRLLLDRENCGLTNGAPAEGFNDITADPLGRVLASPGRGDMRVERKPSELVLITGPNRYAVLYGGILGSNGIAVSPDGERIYHADSAQNFIRVSRFTGDQSVEIIADWPTDALPGHPDGLALDAEGGLWVAFAGGGCIARFDANGAVGERVAIPAKRVTSLCFGGPDLTDLYVVSADNSDDPNLGGCVFLLKGLVHGAPVAVARV